MVRNCRFLAALLPVLGMLALPADGASPSKQIDLSQAKTRVFIAGSNDRSAEQKDSPRSITRDQVSDNQSYGVRAKTFVGSTSSDTGMVLRDDALGPDLFDTWSFDIGAPMGFWTHIENNDFGQDILLAGPSLPNKSYVVDQIGLQYVPIASTAYESWARIRVWSEFDIANASNWTEDGGCTNSDALQSNMIAEVILSFGADDNNVCDTWSRYRVNLVTGEFWDDFDDEYVTLPGMGIKYNSSAAGYIPVGNGGPDLIYVTVEFGTGSGAGHDELPFVEGPTGTEDACNAQTTGPGPHFAFREISPDPDDTGEPGPYELWQLIDLTDLEEGLDNADGKTYFGYQVDGKGNNNGDWNCAEGVAAEGRPGTFWPPVLLLQGHTVIDCNTNGIADDLDISSGASDDLVGPEGGPDGVPDECQTGDCNKNNCWDLCDLHPGCVDECNNNPNCGTVALLDCNNDEIVDSCQLILDGEDNDCNNNGIPDDCDVAEGGSSYDCNENGIPEECEFAAGLIPDCNENGEPDTCDIDSLNGQPAYSPDCDDNDVPDECQISSDSPAPGGPFFCTNGCSDDCDFTGVPDHCERFVRDCNYNGLDDYCDIHIYGEAVDANTNDIPDLCEMAGKTATIDFEDKDPLAYPDVEDLYDYEYVIGPLNEQPIDEDAGDGSYFFGDWSIGEYDGETGEFVGEVTTADHCDVISDSSMGGARHGVFKTRALKPQVASSPNIHMADPNWEVVSAYTPMIQTFEMKVKFDQPVYRVDWHMFFDSIFDDGDNAWNVMVGFETKETSPESGEFYGEIVIWEEDKTIDTGVNWWSGNASDVHILKIEIDFQRTAGYFADAGSIYWDGTEITKFRPRVDYDTGLVPTIDRISIQNDANGLDVSYQGGYLHFDDLVLYHSDGPVECEAYMSDDCDGNGICDVFDLQYFTDIDENNNGVIDDCEWKCNDCNFNGIIDDIEIADGSAVDLDGNGIIDGCEVLSDIPVPGDGAEGVFGFNSSDGFVDGLELSPWGDAAKYSGGWAAIGFASQAAVSSDSGVYPTEGDMFLQVKADPVDGGIGWITGPRQQASDNDIEIWCWDMHVNQLGFDAVYVEIADFCEDGADTYEDYRAALEAAGNDMLAYSASTGANYPPVYPGVNTGMAIRGNDGLITFQEYASATGAVTYESAGENIETNQWGTFAIVIENSTGNTWLFYDADASHDICSRDLIGFEQVSSSSARPLYYQQYLSENSETPDARGDRQLHIRTTSLEEGAANVKFSFDNFRYLAFDDCDANSLPDEFSIESGQVSDHNSDGIPDNCQDCDNSCAGLWEWDTTPARRKSLLISETNAQACVDSFQIATDPDCNGNGQIDACELDATLPYVGAEVSSNNCAGTSPRVECWQYRDADKACDADATGTMDACEVAPETPVEDWDCNGNGCFDTAEIAAGTAPDVDGDGKPDDCMVDCNLNNRDDALDIGQQVGDDYVSCDLWPATSAGDGRPDECCMIEIIENSGLYEPAEPNPDLDHDGDIDVIDYRRLQECEGVLAGSVPRLNTEPPSCLGADTSINGPCPKCHCGCADFNKDGVVDETDVLYFKLRMTGP